MTSDERDLVEAHCVAADATKLFKAAGLDSTLLAHGLFFQAVKVLLNVDDLRAEQVARGLIAIAAVDQQRQITNSIVGSAVAQIIAGKGSTAAVREEIAPAMKTLPGRESIPWLPS